MVASWELGMAPRQQDNGTWVLQPQRTEFCQQPNKQERDYPIDSPERNVAFQYHDSGLGRPVPKFWPTEL